MSTIVPRVSEVSVPLAADVAFEVFVDEIGHWWRPGPRSWHDPARAIGIRFERGEGGRWIETCDHVGEDVSLLGEVTGWVPGERIAMTCQARWLGDGAHAIDIAFLPGEAGTTVTVCHGVPAASADDGPLLAWDTVLGWYREWAAWGSPRRVELPPRRAYILQPGEGLHGDNSLKANGTATLGTLTIIESVTVGGAPPHIHRDDDEAFYVVDGIMTLTIDGRTHEVPAGGFAFVPKGTPHGWDTIGQARILFITAPAGLDQFLARLHAWPTGYADAWRELRERYGYQLV